MDLRAVASYLQRLRHEKGLTQAELGERMGVSAQSVSSWELAKSLPDTALLPELALLYGVSVDEILGGGYGAWWFRRKITVAQMGEAVSCMERMGMLLGHDHFMYRAMVDALNRRMNSDLEAAFSSQTVWDAYVAEALMACVRQGDYVELADVAANIRSEKPREYALRWLREQGLS